MTGRFGVTELAKKKILATQLPSVAGRVTEAGRKTLFSPPRVPPNLVAPSALPSTQVLTEPIPKPMIELGTAITGIKAVDKVGKFGGFAGAIGGIGVGDVLGSVSYDYLFKPPEEELLPF